MMGMSDFPVITIDGPAASGKTSVSRELASRLGWSWVSTGSFYRGLAFVALQKKIDIIEVNQQVNQLVALAHSRDWSVEMGAANTLVRYRDQDVTARINEEEVGSLASKISQFAEVRSALLEMQRNCAKIAAQSLRAGLIAEGRDCGTVVFPDAIAKIYITATGETRAARRAADQGLNAEATLVMQAERDQQDSQRKVAPLQIPDRALVVDSSELGFAEVVQKIEDFVRPLLKRN